MYVYIYIYIYILFVYLFVCLFISGLFVCLVVLFCTADFSAVPNSRTNSKRVPLRCDPNSHPSWVHCIGHQAWKLRVCFEGN